MSAYLRWPLYLLLLLLGCALAAASLVGTVVVLAYPRLPSMEVLTDYQPKIPLRVYTADGQLIGEFGEERRAFVAIKDVPSVMKQAIIAAEDERFYKHGGVDTLGILRAAYTNFISGGKQQGASTITMQVARNFFLSSEKTLTRKLYEALLSFKIEHNFSKDDILQLYINQIYLGQRAYGFSSAAQIYYGKALKDISIAEAAMLAGLPKAPSAYNPVVNPKRAKLRQLYVLRRMQELGFITATEYAEAQTASLRIKHDSNDFGLHAEFVAEMARQIAWDQFHEDTYTRGLKVITTVTRTDQEAAYRALRKGVIDYDRRHGYRGAEAYVDIPATTAATGPNDVVEALEEALNGHEDSDELLTALVLEARADRVDVYLRGGQHLSLTGNALKFAQRMLDSKAPINKRLRRGAIIRVFQDSKKQWQIGQLPEAEAAFVAASPIDGAIQALVGGFDFSRNKFNHVTQAWRQPGSSIKPFIYSASLEKGYSPATVIADEPVVISAAETGSRAWEPKNYGGKFEGPMSLRRALTKSKNMVSIRVLRSIGPQYAQDYLARFGFDPEKHPPYLTMALGSGSVTPWQQLAAYSVFANGGYRVRPYIVRQILDNHGKILAETQPVVAGNENLRVIDARNAYLIDNMLHDVVRHGTAIRAMALKRQDLAGKTGTTNESVDAWFCGYQPTSVGIAWIGFDQPRKLGNTETGSVAALPIWTDYMATALKGLDESFMPQPEGLTAINFIEPSTDKERTEYIYTESLPDSQDDENGEYQSGYVEPSDTTGTESAGTTGTTMNGAALFPQAHTSATATAAVPATQKPAPVQDARPKAILKP